MIIQFWGAANCDHISYIMHCLKLVEQSKRANRKNTACEIPYILDHHNPVISLLSAQTKTFIVFFLHTNTKDTPNSNEPLRLQIYLVIVCRARGNFTATYQHKHFTTSMPYAVCPSGASGRMQWPPGNWRSRVEHMSTHHHTAQVPDPPHHTMP